MKFLQKSQAFFQKAGMIEGNIKQRSYFAMNEQDQLGPEGSYYEAQAQKARQARRARGDALYPLVITAL